MKIKGSYFWYALLILLSLGFIVEKFLPYFLVMKEYIRNIILLFSYVYCFTTFFWNLWELKIGFEFWDDRSYRAATEWKIFRFSPVHFLFFIIVSSVILIVVNPVVAVGKWCDKHLSIGDD